MSTGVAAFTPRLKEGRPVYPKLSYVLFHTVREYARDVLLGVPLVLAVAPFLHRVAMGFEAAGWSERTYWTMMTSLSHSLAFFLFCLPYSVCDSAGWLRGYKLPRKPAQEPKPPQLRELWKDTITGQLLSTPIFTYFVGWPVAVFFGMPSPYAPVTFDFVTVAKWFLFAHACNDFGFYFSHRAFHAKALYGKFHKQHHSFVGTISPATEFSHPVENIFSNIVPSVSGVLFFGRPGVALWVWLFIRLQQTYETHSGYSFAGTWLDFFWIAHADAVCEHDHHHTNNRGCFGAIYLDYAFGTMDAFVACGMADGYRANGGAIDKAAVDWASTTPKAN
jgi:methylsterol monooxygenase